MFKIKKFIPGLLLGLLFIGAFIVGIGSADLVDPKENNAAVAPVIVSDDRRSHLSQTLGAGLGLKVQSSPFLRQTNTTTTSGLPLANPPSPVAHSGTPPTVKPATRPS